MHAIKHFNVRIRKFPGGLTKSVDEDKDVIDANTNDDKERNDIENADSLNPKANAIEEIGYRKADDDDKEPKDGQMEGERGENKDENEDENERRNGKTHVTVNSLVNLIVINRTTSIENANIPYEKIVKIRTF